MFLHESPPRKKRPFTSPVVPSHEALLGVLPSALVLRMSAHFGPSVPPRRRREATSSVSAASHAMRNLRKSHLHQGFAFVVSRPSERQAGIRVRGTRRREPDRSAVVPPLLQERDDWLPGELRGRRCSPTTDQPAFGMFVAAPPISTIRTDEPTICEIVAARRLDRDRDRRPAGRQVEVLGIEVDDRRCTPWPQRRDRDRWRSAGRRRPRHPTACCRSSRAPAPKHVPVSPAHR